MKEVSFNQVKMTIIDLQNGTYQLSAIYRGKEIKVISDDNNMYDYIDIESRPFYCREAKTRAYNLIKKAYKNGKY